MACIRSLRPPGRTPPAPAAYYIAGKNQDEVAAAMAISQAAQRADRRSRSRERLARFWMDHLIARCLDLERRCLASASAFSAPRWCRATPRPTAAPTWGWRGRRGGNGALAALQRPIVMGSRHRPLAEGGDRPLPLISCRRTASSLTVHRSRRIGRYYNVIFSMADAVEVGTSRCRCWSSSPRPRKRALMHGQALIRSTLALAAAADVAFVGIGEMDEEAPLTSTASSPRRTRRRSAPPAPSASIGLASSTATAASWRAAPAPMPAPRSRL